MKLPVVGTTLLLLLSAAWHLPAQTTGSIEGLVLDPSGAAAAGSQVRLIEESTGASRTLETGRNGRFFAPALAPGPYRIEVSATGFQKQIRTGIELAAGRSVQVSFVLRLGEQTETVEVRAEAPVISTSASDWGGALEHGQIVELPSSGRDLFDLVDQKPGASVALNKTGDLHTGKGAQITVNGTRPTQNSYRLDGIYINDAASSAPASANGRLLGIEGIRELNLVSSPFSAEYGRSAGAVVTAVSRAGTNDYQGSAYWFFRDDALNARNFFDPSDQPPLRRNQFGASLGGPVVRDRVFFFANYEGFREELAQTLRSTTITATARQGILPGQEPVPVAEDVKPYLDLFPVPNGADFGDGTAEFVAPGDRSSREDFIALRGDLLWDERLRTAVRYTLDDADQSFPDNFLLWNLSGDSRFQFVHTDTQYIASPNTLHNLRIGFSRVWNEERATDMSSSGETLAFIDGRSLGTIEVTGLGQFGNEQMRTRPRIQSTDNIQVNYEGSHLRGGHAIRFGGGFDQIFFDHRADISFNGRYQFTSLESLLRGEPRLADAMTLGADTGRRWRQRQFSFFLQDEFRPHDRLNVTLGLRYERYTVPEELDGKLASLRNPSSDISTTVGGPLFRNPSGKSFGPRLAIAWDLFGDGRTVLRSGAGVFFDFLGVRETLIGGVRMPPFFGRAFLFRPGFPDLSSAIADAGPSTSVDAFTFNPEQPYVMQFQFQLQRELDRHTAFTLGYAGSRGVHLVGQFGDINLAVPEAEADGSLYFPADAPLINPNFTRIGFRDTAFDSVYHAMNLELTRRMSRGVRLQAAYTWGKLIDNASSAVFQDFTNSDTTPNPFNLATQRARGDFDIRHSLTANVTWLLPRVSSRAAGFVLNGWEAHGIVQAQTGYGYSPSVGFDRARLQSNFGDLGQRPDLVSGNAELISGDPFQYFDPLAFSLPTEGYYGNLGRNALDGPGMFSLNLALHKSLYRRDRHDVRLRIETFNLTNHTNFAVPGNLELFTDDGSRVGSAGRITRTVAPSRQIQVALRWVF